MDHGWKQILQCEIFNWTRGFLHPATKYTVQPWLFLAKKTCLILFVPSRVRIIDIIGFWTLCLKGDTSYCHFIHHPCQFTLQIYSLKELTLDCPPTRRVAETWTKTSWSPRKWSKYRKAWDVPSAQQQPRLTNDCSIIFFFGTGFLLTFVLHFLCLRYRCSLHPRHLAKRARLSRPWKMGSILSLNESPTTIEYSPLLRYPPQICNSWCVFNI